MMTKSFAFGLYIISFFCFSGISQAQTLYALKIDGKIRKEATNITAAYQPRLVMGSDQAMEFKQTVARFLVKRKAIEKDDTLTEKARYELLKQLASKETMAMADVLESYRWQEYIRIKNDIQPLVEPIARKEELIVVNPRDH
ncbi:MAG: hypothetical protein ABJN95_12950 [Maribacter sp.]|uniref:hypothetical protein n=1 Tax=Maribacter sp. TaxID=1897614 RepID=UPI0032968723